MRKKQQKKKINSNNNKTILKTATFFIVKSCGKSIVFVAKGVPYTTGQLKFSMEI